MRSLPGIITAAVLGVALATGTAFGIASVMQQTPGNTAPLDEKTYPKVLYGER